MFNESARHRIHEHRIRLALSPEQFGAKIHVTGHTVRRVEKGYKPILSTRLKFAAELGVTHTDLFGPMEVPEHYLETRLKGELRSQVAA